MPDCSEQVQAALAALRGILGEGLLAVCLHGSAVSGGLRPQSDIDLIAVIDDDLAADPRRDLVTALSRLSARHPAPPEGPRCLEVMVFRRADLAGCSYPARAEFVYGEWLRDAFEAGKAPVPANDPEHTLVLAQARRESVPLLGPPLSRFLPEIPASDVRRAMRALLPTLAAGLHGDEGNILLTLARMWHTASSGAFVTKDAAAAWAVPKVGQRDGATLEYARKAYLGKIADDWSDRHEDARHLAATLARHIDRAL